MEEIAEVYARSLFEVAKDQDELDEVRDELAEFIEAMDSSRELSVFFFSPYFSTEEKKDGLERVVKDASSTFMNFLEALLERHRMPAIFRIRTQYESLWEEENKLLPVHLTSAIELDKATIKQIGEEVRDQTGRKVELSSEVDPEILGGIVLRVGNFILDVSIKNRLNQLRKQVARA